MYYSNYSYINYMLIDVRHMFVSKKYLQIYNLLINLVALTYVYIFHFNFKYILDTS